MADGNITLVGQLEQMDSELDGISSVLQMITHVLGGDADTEKPCQTPGLWFSVQHVARVLTKVKEKVIGLDGSPDDLNDSGPLAIEAAGMAQMVDHLLSANGHASRFDNFLLASYFDAIERCTKALRDELQQCIRQSPQVPA